MSREDFIEIQFSVQLLRVLGSDYQITKILMTKFYNPLPDRDKLHIGDPLKRVSVKAIFTNQTKPEMKESARIFAIIMGIIFGFAAIANTVKHREDMVQIVPCDMGVFKLVYLKESGQNIQVGVLNENGDVLKNDEMGPGEGFIIEYNLNESGSGKYTFRIQDSTGQIDHSVFYDKEHKLVICQMGTDGKFKLVVDNPNDININIFDEDQQLLERDEFSSSRQVTKVYDLSSKIDRGSEVSFMIKENQEFLKIATF